MILYSLFILNDPISVSIVLESKLLVSESKELWFMEHDVLLHKCNFAMSSRFLFQSVISVADLLSGGRFDILYPNPSRIMKILFYRSLGTPNVDGVFFLEKMNWTNVFFAVFELRFSHIVTEILRLAMWK